MTSNGLVTILCTVFAVGFGCQSVAGRGVDPDDDGTDSDGDTGGTSDSDTDGDSDSDTDSDSDSDTDVDSDTDADTDTDPAWPKDVETLPDCTPYAGGFAEPALAESGDVRFDFSARLVPLGVKEKITIEVLKAGSQSRDYGASGTISLDLGDFGSVSDVSSVVSGKATAIVTFSKAGTHTIGATFSGDSRTGSIEIVAYVTQLPIWELTIDEDFLDDMIGDPWERIKVLASINVEGVDYNTEVRLHGGSSRGYKKKSFRFDLGEESPGVGLELPDTHDHLILRAEWNDKTMLRNYLGMAMFRNGTWIHTPKTEMVHYRINQRYYGVMWRVERIGGDFLRTRGLNNVTGLMYEADPENACWAIGAGDLNPLGYDQELYECIYDQQKGTDNYAALQELIEVTLQLDDDAFEKQIESIVDVNEYLAYMATMGVVQNQDHIKKNYYLYKDPDGADTRWIVFPWDMELTFGHLWTEEYDVLDESIFTDKDLTFGVCPGFCNRLMTRLYEVPEYEDRFWDFVDHIVENTFTEDYVDALIDNAVCRGTPDILADSNMRGAVDEYLGRVDEIRDFVKARRKFILEE